MALLQPRLNLKVAQRQVLTPGLMQMVSVLALNKLELKEMIDAEMVENPVLEEIDESVPMFDEVASRQEQLERPAAETTAPAQDSFNEIDFGSYFQDYLDPGYRTQPEYEDSEKPSFENFLSQPTTLSDHLAWQLGALTLDPQVEAAAEFVIGNLDENGYVATSDEELAASFREISGVPLSIPAPENNGHGAAADEESLGLIRRGIDLVQHLDPAGVGAHDLRECLLLQIAAQQDELAQLYARKGSGAARRQSGEDAEDRIDVEESAEVEAEGEEEWKSPLENPHGRCAPRQKPSSSNAAGRCNWRRSSSTSTCNCCRSVTLRTLPRL